LVTTSYKIKPFYYADLEEISKHTEEHIIKVNENLNHLQSLLNKRGIQLYFMPCVSKYDLYSSYIVNNPYSESRYFEYLREMERFYTLIDTKAILSNALKRGEKDLFLGMIPTGHRTLLTILQCS